MEKYYEKDLPENYRLIYSIDAKSAKVGLIFTMFSFVILFGVLFICSIPLILNSERLNDILIVDSKYLIAYLVFFLSMILYIVLHELVHGVAYKILTKQKLTFGISWCCAFCGVPNVYCYRKTALIALVSPLITFSILLIPLTIILFFIDPIYYLMSSFILALHLSGCIGDIYMTLLLLFKFKSKNILMNDTGPKQTIYINE